MLKRHIYSFCSFQKCWSQRADPRCWTWLPTFLSCVSFAGFRPLHKFWIRDPPSRPKRHTGREFVCAVHCCCSHQNVISFALGPKPPWVKDVDVTSERKGLVTGRFAPKAFFCSPCRHKTKTSLMSGEKMLHWSCCVCDEQKIPFLNRWYSNTCTEGYTSYIHPSSDELVRKVGLDGYPCQWFEGGMELHLFPELLLSICVFCFYTSAKTFDFLPEVRRYQVFQKKQNTGNKEHCGEDIKDALHVHQPQLGVG